MEFLDPEWRQRLDRLFQKAAFIQNLGLKPGEVGAGYCETHLEIQNYHKQQNRLVHAGVLATMADHSAGGAATTLLKPSQYVLTVEFKVNLLRPAQGRALRCRAQVLKAGARLSFVESEVFCRDGEGEALVAKASVTLAVLENLKEENP
ncbi:MAG TPA: PaaI family thioesterase [bacterium]|nr:PaaI family thioesterase [bacterium]